MHFCLVGALRMPRLPVFLSCSVVLHLAVGFFLFGRDAASAAMPPMPAAAKPQVVQVMLAPAVAKKSPTVAQAVVQDVQPAPPEPQIKPVKSVKPEQRVTAALKPKPQAVPVRVPAPPTYAQSKPVRSVAALPVKQPVAHKAPAKAAGPSTAATKPVLATAALENIEMEVFSHQPAFRLPPQQPRYPAQARRRNQQGVVLLEVRLDAHGKQRAITLLRSSGFSSLDSAALEAVAGWYFHPEIINGKGVPSRVEIPIEFALLASR